MRSLEWATSSTFNSYKLYCNNTVAIHIVENPIFNEHTKHIEVNCHLVHQKTTEDKIIELNMFLPLTN